MAGDYPLIILEVQREDGRLKQAFEQLKLPYNVAIEVSTIDTLKHYVARGLGIAVITGFAFTREDQAHLDVVPVPEDIGGATTYGVVLRRGKHGSVLLKSLLAVLTTFDQK